MESRRHWGSISREILLKPVMVRWKQEGRLVVGESGIVAGSR
jgi:hypothetical protein